MIARIILVVLFFLGVGSLLALGLWTLGLILWVGNESATDPGLVAEIPKGIFTLVPLILLALLPAVRETLERMGFHD